MCHIHDAMQATGTLLDHHRALRVKEEQIWTPCCHGESFTIRSGRLLEQDRFLPSIRAPSGRNLESQQASHPSTHFKPEHFWSSPALLAPNPFHLSGKPDLQLQNHSAWFQNHSAWFQNPSAWFQKCSAWFQKCSAWFQNPSAWFQKCSAWFQKCSAWFQKCSTSVPKVFRLMRTNHRNSLKNKGYHQ